MPDAGEVTAIAIHMAQVDNHDGQKQSWPLPEFNKLLLPADTMELNDLLAIWLHLLGIIPGNAAPSFGDSVTWFNAIQTQPSTAQLNVFRSV